MKKSNRENRKTQKTTGCYQNGNCEKETIQPNEEWVPDYNISLPLIIMILGSVLPFNILPVDVLEGRKVQGNERM